MNNFRFSGHETFFCRNYWLKKGLDFLWEGGSFKDDLAVVKLGVGRNMVSSLRFWLQAFDLLNENGKPNDLAHFFFHPTEGVDPYSEDIATIWLLHYLLVTKKKSSIYHLVFNEFRKHRIEFEEKHLKTFLERTVNESDSYVHPSSIKKDIRVFLQNYLLPQKSKGVEDDLNRLLHELNLVQRIEGSKDWYKIENARRPELPSELVLFCICHFLTNEGSITFRQLAHDEDSIGSVFALSENGLLDKIEDIVDRFPKNFVFTDDGGVGVLQIKNQIDYWSVLKAYYGN